VPFLGHFLTKIVKPLPASSSPTLF